MSVSAFVRGSFPLQSSVYTRMQPPPTPARSSSIPIGSKRFDELLEPSKRFFAQSGILPAGLQPVLVLTHTSVPAAGTFSLGTRTAYLLGFHVKQRPPSAMIVPSGHFPDMSDALS